MAANASPPEPERFGPATRADFDIGAAVPTILRLKRRPDFLAAAGGRRFHTERLTAQCRRREAGELRAGLPAEGLYLGLTITKRVGHATERNRIRRRLWHAVKSVADDAPDCAADIVLIARRPALDASFETLLDDLRRAFAVVTKARAPKAAQERGKDHGDAASGARRRSGAHVPRQTNPGKTSHDENTAHGSTDG